MPPAMVDVTFPAELATIAAARTAAAEACRYHGFAPLADTVRLCTSELVTNALCHTHSTQIRVRLQPLAQASIRVSVTDDSREPPRRSATAPGPGATGGRGLHIIAALSAATGHHITEHGKTVWCDIAGTR